MLKKLLQLNLNFIFLIGDRSERNDLSRKDNTTVGPLDDDPDDQPPNLDWDDDHGPPSDGEEMPPGEPGSFNRLVEMPRERMQLRQQAPVLANIVIFHVLYPFL